MEFGDVEALVRQLAAHSVRAWLFGGWAEQVHRLAPPRLHKDVDLLYPAPDFALLDAFMRTSGVREYDVKRSPCSRGFDHDGELVEFYLVQSNAECVFTDFWGYLHRWPADTLTDSSDCPVASAASLASARSVWTHVERAYDGYAAGKR